MKPNRPIGVGLEGILIGIFILKIITFLIVFYQTLFREKTFVAEIIDLDENSAMSHILRVVYIAFIL